MNFFSKKNENIIFLSGRGEPTSQTYRNTALKLSNIRINDEL